MDPLLTLQETLRLFQMPLGMDPLLVGLNPGHRLPFVDQPSPDLFTSFFRQLWGDNGEGSGDVEGEEEKYEEYGDEGGGGAAVSTDLAGNVANISRHVGNDTTCRSNFGQMGPCRRHKI